MTNIENAVVEITTDVEVPQGLKDIQMPKYILKLGVPVTHRWVDKDGKHSRTYPVGTELGVIFPFVVRRRNQKWADCVTAEGIVLTIGHNRKHQLIQISGNDASVEFDGVNLNDLSPTMIDNNLPIDNPVE